MSTKRLIAVPPGYPEELLNPLPRKTQSGCGGTHAGEREYLRRVAILADYYGISENQGSFLAALLLRVLSDWVPGFREDRRGRPSDTGQPEKRARLVSAVTDLKMANPRLSDTAACQALAKNRQKTNEFRGEHFETLRKWFRMGMTERKRKNARLAKALLEWSPPETRGDEQAPGLFGLGGETS